MSLAVDPGFFAEIQPMPGMTDGQLKALAENAADQMATTAVIRLVAISLLYRRDRAYAVDFLNAEQLLLFRALSLVEDVLPRRARS